jgi:hypothetical protein
MILKLGRTSPEAVRKAGAGEVSPPLAPSTCMILARDEFYLGEGGELAIKFQRTFSQLNQILSLSTETLFLCVPIFSPCSYM